MTSQELKNSILQLAVQGKLVPQDPNDEPAAELLNRIKAEREKRIKEGTLSIDKKHTADPITEDDILYDLPDQWEWVRFADIVTFYSGKTPQRQHASYWTNGNIPWVSIADMRADASISTTKESVSEVAFNECFSGKISPAGTMIMSFKLTIGKVSILEMDAVHNEAIISISPTASNSDSLVLKKYLFKVMPLIATTGNAKNAIKGKTLNATSISNLMIPLPPLAEQERIVTKIEELLPLVAEYGETEQKLSALNAEFPDRLRKSILQQAVQGKFTERDPADEPAAELLKRIRAEKGKLIAEGKIKKEKPLPLITEDECPFEIPDTWTWVHLRDICSLIGDIDHNMPKSVNPEEGVLFLSAKDLLDDGTINYTNNVKYISQNDFERLSKKALPRRNDIIYSRIGAALGKARVVESDITFLVSYSCCVIRPLYVDIWFLRYYLESPYILSYSVKARQSIGVPDLGMGEIKKYLVALPPLAEQKRIVDRVNELLSVCDGLK